MSRATSRRSSIDLDFAQNGLATQLQQQQQPRILQQFDFQEFAEVHSDCTILFADLCQYTKLSTLNDGLTMCIVLHSLYSAWDQATEDFRDGHVMKLDVVGDSYIAVTGVDKDRDNARVMIRFAIEMVRSLAKIELPRGFNLNGAESLTIRIGIATGSCYGGLLGIKHRKYSLFGDSVNLASRLESTGIPGQIQVSEQTLVQSKIAPDAPGLRPRLVEMKGKGIQRTFVADADTWERLILETYEREPRDLHAVRSRAPTTVHERPPQSSVQMGDVWMPATKSGMADASLSPRNEPRYDESPVMDCSIASVHAAPHDGRDDSWVRNPVRLNTFQDAAPSMKPGPIRGSLRASHITVEAMSAGGHDR